MSPVAYVIWLPGVDCQTLIFFEATNSLISTELVDYEN